MNISSLLSEALQENNLSLERIAQEQLIHYLDLMQTWNRVVNLTTITKPRDMVYLHIIDSLVVQPYLHGSRLLDVGSGAGLPGIPLAIANPHRQWVLLDKNSKKTRFLTQVAAELKLHHVEIIHSRSEDFHPAQCFDSILSRALGTLRLFAQSTGHLLCQEGLLLAMKGKYPQGELDDLRSPFQLVDSTRLKIKGNDVERHLVRLSIDKRE